MRDWYRTIIYAGIAIILTCMFAVGWYCEYANLPVYYTTIETVDKGGFEHDCLVVTYKKAMALDCANPND